MIATYVHGNSLLHRLQPGVKLLLLLIAGTGLFFIDQWWCLIALLLSVTGLFRAVGLPANLLYQQIVPLAWLLGFIFVGHLLFTDWLSGAVVVLRLLVLVLLAALVTLTTRMSQMIDAITRIASPLERFGIQSARLGLMLALTVRYIPLLLSRYVELREAQQARCARAGTFTLLLPLLIQSLRLADQLAEAIDARAYDTLREPVARKTDGLQRRLTAKR